MTIKFWPLLFILYLLPCTSFLFPQITCESKKINAHTFELIFSFDVPQNDFIYKDYLTFTADSPHIELTEYTTNIEPLEHYDQKFGETKKIYNKPFSASLQAKILSNTVTHGFIHITYYQHSKKKYQTELFALQVETRTYENNASISPLFKSLPQSPHRAIIAKTESAWDLWLHYIQRILQDWQAPLILCGVVSLIAILFLLPWLHAAIIIMCALLFYILFLLFPWH